MNVYRSLFITAKTWKQPTYPLVYKLYIYIYNYIYYIYYMYHIKIVVHPDEGKVFSAEMK